MRFSYFLCASFILLTFFKTNAQVSLQSGSGNFSLPIFNWQDDKSRLNSVVALSYSSGNGLRVNEVSSNVGQGWDMIAGGVISRQQNGEPDDQVERTGAVNDITKYPAGKLFASVSATMGYSTALTKYPIFESKNQMYAQHNLVAEDKQLDYFSFRFNGKAGTFVLNPANVGTAISIGDTKMKITFQLDYGLSSQGIRTSITSFNIQDVDGLIYKFSAKGLTKLLQTDFCDEFFVNRKKQPKFKNDQAFYQTMFDVGPSAAPWANSEMANPFVVNNWFLTEIEDALTHRKIYFNYGATRNINNTAGEDITINNSKKEYAIVSHKISIEQTPALTSIVYPDGHNTNFNYGGARFDLNGDFVLQSIDVLYQGRYLSRHELNTTYFILNRYGVPTTDYQKRMARLCLKSVRKIGIDLKEDTPPYIFDYYTGSSTKDDFVPPPYTFAKDIWGYYNGENSKGWWEEPIPLDIPTYQINHYNKLRGLCYLRHASPGVLIVNPKAGYAKNGLLKQIIYPTGGTLTYEYEQNTGTLNGSPFYPGGVHVSKTSSTDGGYSNNCANPITTNYNYVIAGGSQSSMWGLELPKNDIGTSNHYQPEWKKFKLRLFQFPTCVWKFQYPGIISQNQAISQTALRNQAILSTAMTVLSVLGTVSDILRFAAAETGGLSLIIDMIVEVVEFAVACIGDQSKNTNTTSWLNYNLNAASPLPTQFKRVEVVENNGSIGKTVQEFTSADDYPIWELSNAAYSSKQRYAPWAYGLPKITSVYDVNGQLIKQTINEYNTTDTCVTVQSKGLPVPPVCNPMSKVPLNIKSAKSLVLKTSSQRSTIWIDPNVYGTSYQATNDDNMKVEIYDMYTGRTELKSTSERIYKPSNPTQFLQTKTEYFYNTNYNYDINRIVTTQSNGDINTKYIKYTSDYNTGVLATLVQNNIVSLPVSTYSTVAKNGNGAGNDLNISDTEFTQLANGDIKPLRLLEKRFAAPSVPTGYYGGPGSNVSAYKIPQTFSYDASGNLIGVKDEGNRTITNLYDYDDKYIVASVINADATADKTAYTSFETSSFGKWTLTGPASYAAPGAATGGRSFILSSNSLQASSLNTAKPYIVSFWSTTAGVTVTGGATLTKSAPTYNNFTYYEYDIAQGTSTVTISGSGTIDELRIYPKTARMRTTTYDPVIGKTSECDENNRITFYEYDNLGRLRFIKDEKKNIVKMYEYNNVSAAKQNGCPGIYYNKLISELYTRSNCGQGFIGDTVRFTVPANAYSSTISQMDADLKAEFYLQANGPTNANNLGQCLWVYSNVAMSQIYTSESCGPGFLGGSVTYTVPAGRYTSLVSQQDANDKAQDDIDANGDWYANSLEHRICTPDYNPEWEWPEDGQSNCQLVGGVYHLFIYEKDINPNSSSYGSFQWNDVGPNEACSGTTTYYNTMKKVLFTRNNCSPGYNGSSVFYTVPAGTYTSTISQAAADQLALDDVAANGQNYANTHGTCTPGECVWENCHALNEAYQCINGQCEYGVYVLDSTYYDSQLGQWVCVYHYEYSDGSWTAAFYSYGNSPCYSN